MDDGEPVQVPEKRARCTVYIDGFNWYYGIFKDKPEWKWLNIQSFFEELRKDDDVLTVTLFTALVGPDHVFTEARHRQMRFLKAISSLSKVRIIYGYFQLRDKTCLASCGLDYKEPEEKKTDVNMAVTMISDVIKNLTDSIVVVSGDSDLQPAVEWIVRNYPRIKVSVYIPSLEQEKGDRRADYYFKLRVPCKFLPLDKLAQHQLPPRMWLKNGEMVEKPPTWS